MAELQNSQASRLTDIGIYLGEFLFIRVITVTFLNMTVEQIIAYSKELCQA